MNIKMVSTYHHAYLNLLPTRFLLHRLVKDNVQEDLRALDEESQRGILGDQ